MGKCNPPCRKTASLNGLGGNRIMVAGLENKKFPEGTPHPQCPDCAKEECKEMMAQIAKAFPKSDIALFEKLDRFKSKFKGS